MTFAFGLCAMQSRYSDENSVRPSVCPSVRPSVTRVNCDLKRSSCCPSVSFPVRQRLRRLPYWSSDVAVLYRADGRLGACRYSSRPGLHRRRREHLSRPFRRFISSSTCWGRMASFAVCPGQHMISVDCSMSWPVAMIFRRRLGCRPV